MSSSLSALKNIFKKQDSVYRLSKVIAVDGEKITTETETGIILTVWGLANVSDWVITGGDQILGRVSLQDTQTVYVA